MDYIDKYSISVCTKKQITAQEVYDMIFSDYPPLVRLLFNIRNKIVKRFGLKASNGFNDLIPPITYKLKKTTGIYFLKSRLSVASW